MGIGHKTVLRLGFGLRYYPHVTTTDIYLERIDGKRSMARYYRLSITETLFGGWAMVREWGRIGRRGQSREHWCATLDEARECLEQQRRLRARRGYRIPDSGTE